MRYNNLDLNLINLSNKVFVPLARFSIFTVYFYFGLLKLVGLSPAGELVHNLFDQTISFMSFDKFYTLFSLFEMLIGLLFIIPKATRVVIPLLFVHIITTIMPLFLLQDTSWQGFLVPTLAGQYIIKNIVIVACAIGIASHLHIIKNK